MFRQKKIARNQKLLAMYRALLAEYLRQEKAWDKTQVPEFLSTGVMLLRREITDIKGKLRGWKVVVLDEQDDDGPSNEIAREVLHQQKLLDIHRTTLLTYLKQVGRIGENQATPIMINSIAHARDEIEKIKAILRGWNVPVEDLPEDESS